MDNIIEKDRDIEIQDEYYQMYDDKLGNDYNWNLEILASLIYSDTDVLLDEPSK